MLNRNNPTPLYIQLENILKEQIQNHTWSENQAIPSENQLSKEYGLSRMTVRSVITNLVNEGLLYRIQGKGTFVSTPKIDACSPAYVGIREQLEKQGFVITTELSQFTSIQPEKKIAQSLNLAPSDEVLYIERVRSANGIPVSIHRSYIPQHLCPHLAKERLIQEQLCTVLEESFDLKAHSVHETLESVLANDTEAQLLGIENGHPLLLLKELNYLQNMQPFEYTKIAFRGDKIKLSFDY